MSRKSSWAAWTIGVALLVSAFGTAASAPTTIKLTTGDWLSPRPRVAAFQLIDDGGQSFTQANLAGHWSMLLFGYTHCTDVCPATLAILASLERRELAAGREGPRVLFVSADVARDTPRDLQAFVRRFNRAFVGLTALDQRSIDQLARTLDTAVVVHGESRGNYSVDHTGAIFVVDPRGALAAVLTGPMTPAALQADFDRIVVAAR